MSDVAPKKKTKPAVKKVSFKQGNYKCVKCGTVVHVFVDMNFPPAHYHANTRTHHMMEYTKSGK